MTKLLEWLFGISVFLSIWGALVCKQIQSQLIEKWMFLIMPLPVILIILFGLYAVAVILWRVYTFNDCELAAKELQLAQEQKSSVWESLLHIGLRYNSRKSLQVFIAYRFDPSPGYTVKRTSIFKEIQQAKQELRQKGITFNSDK